MFLGWRNIFASDTMRPCADLDYLHHRLVVINVRGESYRLMDKLAGYETGLTMQAVESPYRLVVTLTEDGLNLDACYQVQFQALVHPSTVPLNLGIT